jgi:hypothetical protein
MPGVGYFSHCASSAADNNSAHATATVAADRLIEVTLDVFDIVVERTLQRARVRGG